ncbi:MAG: RNA 2',3'-cyclic phosphodiesterase [Lachnospiraceae bacterium]|nr:RNA 2',3'-cyclic phosphodiesterase [Lachnospiraceae bacterium]
MRLFVAINFPPSILKLLQHDISELRKNAISGNFTPNENLHLTLAFLGETPEKKIPLIHEAMKTAWIGYQPSFVTIKGFGKFIMRGEILYWRGMECSKEVLDMQQKLVEALGQQGFAMEDRPFTPHITMGRRCRMKKSFLEQEYESTLVAADMEVAEISLMKSERINGRMVYTSIYSIPK